jgi:hypothetical protein
MAPAPPDNMKTASIPAKAEPKPAAQPAAAPATAAAQPATYKAPDRTETVDDAAKKEVASAAPEATGIGKYRWPVRGAVIAAYGANVERQPQRRYRHLGAAGHADQGRRKRCGHLCRQRPEGTRQYGSRPPRRRHRHGLRQCRHAERHSAARRSSAARHSQSPA